MTHCWPLTTLKQPCLPLPQRPHHPPPHSHPLRPQLTHPPPQQPLPLYLPDLVRSPPLSTRQHPITPHTASRVSEPLPTAAMAVTPPTRPLTRASAPLARCMEVMAACMEE